jgi:6-phosphogluconolactonase
MAQVLAPPAGELPRFDLILLGLGEDGHTASLFPSHPLLRETVRWAAPVFDSPKPPPERITLTLPVLNNARDIVFIAAGAGKADALARVLGSDATHDALPARLVQPYAGRATWFVDEAAASKLGGGVHDAAGG